MYAYERPSHSFEIIDRQEAERLIGRIGARDRRPLVRRRRYFVSASRTARSMRSISFSAERNRSRMIGIEAADLDLGSRRQGRGRYPVAAVRG